MTKTIRERAVDLGMKAMGKLMEDPRRAEKVASLVSGAQRGREALGRAQTRALHLAGLVSRSDMKALGRRLSALKHRVRDLDAVLAAIERKVGR